jgi:hypothetical protein
MRRIVAILILWLWFCALPFAVDPVTIRVNPRLGMLPLTISIYVRVEPYAGNRELCVLWGMVEEDMYSSSCVALDGMTARTSYQWYRTLRIPGEWAIIAVIRRSDESVHRARITVTVIGGV